MQPAFRPDRLVGAERPARPLPGWSWPIAAAALLLTGIGGARLVPADSQLTVWWPAAGLAVVFVILAGRDRRWWAVLLVFGTMTAANAANGRPIALCLVYGFADALETLVVTLVLQRGGRDPRLWNARSALDLLIAAAAGGATAGVIIGTIGGLAGGGPVVAWVLVVTSSHITATLLVAPFGLLPPRTPDPLPWPEIIVQSALTAASVLLVFAPGNHLPLTFIPFALLLWASLRFPAPIAFAENLVASVTMIALTLMGFGPFSAPSVDALGLGSMTGGLRLALLVELYLVVLSVFVVVLVAARYQARLSARTTQTIAQLISGGFVDSRVGLIIAEHRGDDTAVIWANRAAVEMVGDELAADGIWRGPLARNAWVSMAEQVQTVHEDPERGSTVSLLAGGIPGDEERFAIQLVDVGAAIRMARAREEAEQERQAAQTERRDLERQRDDFVATTSHELRTPITSIAGYTELLGESPSLGELERSWLRIIARNTARLAQLVEDLLSLGRSSAYAPTARVRTVRMSDLVEDAVSVHRPLADRAGITLIAEVDDAARARCVPADAARALGNLLSNAVKFTPVGGVVRIRSGSHDGAPALTVTDTGPGMSPETLAQAFERFYRAPDAEQESTPGTGLGLSIARQLARRNGGDILLVSEDGGGLEATLVFASETEA